MEAQVPSKLGGTQQNIWMLKLLIIQGLKRGHWVIQGIYEKGWLSDFVNNCPRGGPSIILVGVLEAPKWTLDELVK
jgi:hypothetical protein